MLQYRTSCYSVGLVVLVQKPALTVSDRSLHNRTFCHSTGQALTLQDKFLQYRTCCSVYDRLLQRMVDYIIQEMFIHFRTGFYSIGQAVTVISSEHVVQL